MPIMKGFGSTPRDKAVDTAVGMSSTAVALLLITSVRRVVMRMKADRIKKGFIPRKALKRAFE
jgi:hypothetical protein